MAGKRRISPEAEFRSRLSWFQGVSDPVAIDPDALTYEPYFGLRDKPFSLAADPRFFFTESGHGTAFNSLAAGIKRREGILVLTGEVGTGKTTLCHAVIQALDRKTFAAFVSDPFLSPEDLLKTLLVDFGVVSSDEARRGWLRAASRADLSRTLYDFLASLVPLKAFAVVILDEAQNLSPDVLDELCVLSDLESGSKLLQVFLVGQPELETRLADTALRQLAQRVALRCELPPLSREEVGRYIAHRLEVAGNDGRVRFTDAAVDAVHDASGGIPRVVNLLCDRAMTWTASLKTCVVDVESVAWGRADLKMPGAPTPALALVHSQPTRPAWRELTPEDFPEELELPPPPESLVRTVSNAMGERAEAERSAREHRVAPPQTARSAPNLYFLLGAALVIIGAIAGYRFWPTRAEAPAPSALEQPAAQAPAATPPAAAETRAPAPPADTAAPAAETTPVPPQTRVAILMATFASDDRMAKSLQEIRDAGFPAFSVEETLRDGGKGLAVYVGPYDDRSAAERDLDRARSLAGYEGARIVSIKPTTRP